MKPLLLDFAPTFRGDPTFSAWPRGLRRKKRGVAGRTVLITCAIVAASASEATPAAKKTSAPPRITTTSASQDTGLTMHGGQSGTVFRSLTVEGEDRVHFDFERPELRIDLDPTKAPGLDWGSASDVLDRTVPDATKPFMTMSAREPSPYVGHPWLSRFVSGPVARFRPELKDVDRWKLTIVNARGETVTSFTGRGEPPDEIEWDGRSQSGAPVSPGLTYSYVLEARDRAGNKRNFVGQGFQISAYRIDTPDGPMMTFSGRELQTARRVDGAAARGTAAPIVIEAASWLNQRAKPSVVRVTATARSRDQAQALSAAVSSQIAPHLWGDPSKLETVTDVQPDAPEDGAVRIASVR